MHGSKKKKKTKKKKEEEEETTPNRVTALFPFFYLIFNEIADMLCFTSITKMSKEAST